MSRDLSSLSVWETLSDQVDQLMEANKGKGLDAAVVLAVARGMRLPKHVWEAPDSEEQDAFRVAASQVSMDDYGPAMASLFEANLDEGFPERLMPWLEDRDKEILGHCLAQMELPAVFTLFRATLTEQETPAMMASVLGRAIHHQADATTLKRIWDAQVPDEVQPRCTLMSWLTLHDPDDPDDDEEAGWGRPIQNGCKTCTARSPSARSCQPPCGRSPRRG